MKRSKKIRKSQKPSGVPALQSKQMSATLIDVKSFVRIEANIYCAEVESIDMPQCYCNSLDKCGSNCLNKMMAYECSTNCVSGDKCQNCSIQKGLLVSIEIIRVAEKGGFGVRTNQPIKK